jgi:hypothetical protein
MGFHAGIIFDGRVPLQLSDAEHQGEASRYPNVEARMEKMARGLSVVVALKLALFRKTPHRANWTSFLRNTRNKCIL